MTTQGHGTKLPKDYLVIQQILKDMGVQEYEPRVVNQLLEFVYRYVTSVLEEARLYSNHAKKKNIDLDDVKLAVQMQLEQKFTTPPPREVLLEVARMRNSNALPLIKPHCGLRLPPDRFCLTACNYKLEAIKKKGSKGSKSSAGSYSTAFSSSKYFMSNNYGSGSGGGGSRSSGRVPKGASSSGGGSGKQTKTVSVPKPIIKFTSGPPASSSQSYADSADTSHAQSASEQSSVQQLQYTIQGESMKME